MPTDTLSQIFSNIKEEHPDIVENPAVSSPAQKKGLFY